MGSHLLTPLSHSSLPAFHRLDLKDILNTTRLVAPDLGVLVSSSLCLGLCGRLTRKARQSQRTQELVRDCGSQDGGKGVSAQVTL